MAFKVSIPLNIRQRYIIAQALDALITEMAEGEDLLVTDPPVTYQEVDELRRGIEKGEV